MRAIRVHQTGGAEALSVDEVPTPEPGAGEVLVRLEAIGVNYVDIYFRSGLYPVQLPVTTGQEGAGTVTRLGSGVTDVRVGDRVAFQGTNGAYADYIAVPAARVVPVPDGVTTRQAAAILLQGMTAHYLAFSTYPLQRGDWCIVHAAAGGVGLLLCQIAKMIGARVIGTASTAEKIALAHAAGAEEMVNYTTHDFAAEARRVTGGAGVSVVYDSVGRTTFDKSLDSLRPRGMLVLFGQSSGPVGPFDPGALSRKGSLFLTRPTLGNYVATRDELLWRSSQIFEWVRDGKLDVRIDRELPLTAAADAQRALESRATKGKVLLIP